MNIYKINRFRFLSVFMTVVILLLVFLSYPVYASQDYYEEAVILDDLGVFQGTSKGYELGRQPTRIEGLVLFIRLIGKEEEAKQLEHHASAFSDVPSWAVGYANYAYREGLTNGTGDGRFDSDRLMSANEYVTYLLRALGYDDQAEDFTWNTAIEKAVTEGIITQEDADTLYSEVFLRDHIVFLSMASLQSHLKGMNLTLIQSLVNSDDIDYRIAFLYGLADVSYKGLIDTYVELPEDDYDEAEAGAIIDRIMQLPQAYIERLVSFGNTIRLVANPITEEEEFSYLAGVVPRGWEGTGLTWDNVPGGATDDLIIVRIGYSFDATSHGSCNLELHEIGHSIDSLVFKAYGLGSSSQAFREVYQLERFRLFGDNAYYGYPEEYFAETIAMYYLGAETRFELQTNAPETYAFIQEAEALIGE